MALAITKFVSKNLDRVEAGHPVVLLLHGYGADEHDLPELMNVLPDLPWASLRAPVSLNGGGFAWYKTSTPLEPTADQMNESTHAIWEWVDDHLPAESPLAVFGFSQGGLMATQLLRTRPRRLAATVVLSGFVFGGEQPADAELTTLKPKVFYGRGAQDQLIPRDSVKNLNVWLQSHARAQTATYEGLGHSIDNRVMADVAAYLAVQLS